MSILSVSIFTYRRHKKEQFPDSATGVVSISTLVASSHFCRLGMLQSPVMRDNVDQVYLRGKFRASSLRLSDCTPSILRPSRELTSIY